MQNEIIKTRQDFTRGSDYAEYLWRGSRVQINTIVNTVREPFLILDAKLIVLSANRTFYSVFQVTKEGTEGKKVYSLGNGQWNIPELKRLLEEILPKKKTIKDYEVNHAFETIGKKTMLLNARQIDSVQLIIIAIEDVTAKKDLEEKLAKYTKNIEAKIIERTTELASRVEELELVNKSMVGRELKMVELKKEIHGLKKLIRNGNGKKGKKKSGKGNHANG